MEIVHHNKILLLDFGYPMSENTFNIIKKSVQNILTLALMVPQNKSQISVGISVLNSDFTLIQSLTNLKKNYKLVANSLDSLNEKIKINERVTVKEYKHLLSTSIEMILEKLQAEFKNDFRHEGSIFMTVMTKKTAPLVAQILTNVTSKLHKHKIPKMKKIKIIQILNEEGENLREEENEEGISQKNNCLIDWITCSDSKHDIDSIFKDWLLNPDCEQQLTIILSKEIDLLVKCDVEDCVVKTFDENLFLYNEVANKTLDVVNRIELSGFCSTLIFGIPRRLYATQSWTLSCVETQINHQIFKQLCEELQQTEQGLLVKSSIEIEGNVIDIFHLIISDGHILLINDVASDELSLPKRRERLRLDPHVDESAASVVKTSLQKIEFLEEFAPKNFSSGLYECLRNYFMRARERTGHFGHHGLSRGFPGRNLDKQSKFKEEHSALRQDESQKTTTEEIRTRASQHNKKHKSNSEAGTSNIHPALLSPSVVAKYRKVHPSAFNLPELGPAFTINEI